MGNRMSSLPITQYCGAAGTLNEMHGAGRAAAMSSAFHALAGGVENAQDLVDRLTDDEQEEIRSWKTPLDVDLGDGAVLRYRDALKEIEVTLGVDGETCDPGTAISVGHIDMLWTPEITGLDIVYVGDLKKSDWSSPDGPTSLQMMAYGFAAAARWGASGFCCGHWNVTEGEWDWSPPIDLFDMSTAKLWRRVKAAAQNMTWEFSTGPHCRNCYGRLHCQEYLLPIKDPTAALAPFAKPEGITAENAPRLVELYASAKKVLEVVKDTLEAYADRAGGIPDGNGKVWRKTMTTAPSVRFDTKKFEQENPELAKRYTSMGPPRSQGYRWCNQK